MLGTIIAQAVGWGDKVTVVIGIMAAASGACTALFDTRIKAAQEGTEEQYKLITKELKRDTDFWAVVLYCFGTPGLVKSMLSVPTGTAISGWILLFATVTAMAGLLGAYNSLLKLRLSSLELKQERIAQAGSRQGNRASSKSKRRRA